MEQRSLRKKESSFSLSSEKSGKERKPKATRIIVLLHQFNFGIYIKELKRYDEAKKAYYKADQLGYNGSLPPVPATSNIRS